MELGPIFRSSPRKAFRQAYLQNSLGSIFNIDTVYCNFLELVYCSNEIPLIQPLVVECQGPEQLWLKYGRLLYLAKALDTITILHLGHDAEYES